MWQSYFKLGLNLKVKILNKERLNSEIMRFILEKPWNFQAGQYTILDFNGQQHYFSIASPPQSPYLELDIQNSPFHPLHPDFASFLNQTQYLDLSPPQGGAVLQDNNRPIILVAGGSGIAPLKSIGEAAEGREIHLYWGVRNRSCFYDLKILRYIPVLSEERVPGIRFGLVHEAVLADFNDLSSFDIYLAGPFNMAYTARNAFLIKGGQKKSIFADAFSFESQT